MDLDITTIRLLAVIDREWGGDVCEQEIGGDVPASGDDVGDIQQ